MAHTAKCSLGRNKARTNKEGGAPVFILLWARDEGLPALREREPLDFHFILSAWIVRSRPPDLSECEIKNSEGEGVWMLEGVTKQNRAAIQPNKERERERVRERERDTPRSVQ